MKILLTMNVPYSRISGGANRSNRGLCEALAARGHTVQTVVPALATPSPITNEEHVRQLEAKGIRVSKDSMADIFVLKGVEVHAAREASHLRACLEERIKAFAPDWILVSSEDPSQNLLAAALKHLPHGVVYLALTPPLFPFGPESLYPGAARKELVKQAAAVVTIGKFAAEYIRKWCGIDAHIIHAPHYGAGPFPYLASFDNPYILLMNACDMKGLPIFLEMARRFPEARFGVLAGYGTTESDRRAIKLLPNATFLNNAEDLDEIFRQTRILLVPSLWVESFGLAVVDAMLRGIPVLASNFGGLVDAKLGTDYLLPVNPIETFREELDSNLLPIPEIPEQPMDTWAGTLRDLISDRALYQRQSEASRNAAFKFVSALSVTPLEQLLASLNQRNSSQAELRQASPPTHASSMTKSKNQLIDSISELTPLQREVLARKLRKKKTLPKSAPEASRQSSIPAISNNGPSPLSFAQQRIWFVEQLDPGTSAFNIPAAERLPGSLHVGALRAAVNEVVRRHETLRTRFELLDRQPVQVVQAPGLVPLPIVSLEGLTSGDRDREACGLARREALKAFDLKEDMPLRVMLVRLGPTDHLVLYTVHHIASDAWSSDLLDAELHALYEAYSAGKPSPLAELPIQYRDFTVWQREWLQNGVLETQLNYWRKQLSGAPATLELPADQPRFKAAAPAAAVYRFVLSSVLADRLKALAAREDVTPYMILLAAFDTLLFRYTGQTDILVATPIANRNHAEIEKMIGFFANVLVLRADLSGDPSFRELLRRVKEVTLGAYAHQDLPFEKIVEDLRPERDSGYSPFTPVILTFQRTPIPAARAAEAQSASNVEEYRIAKTDLTCSLLQAPDGLIGVIEYRADLFAGERVKRFAKHFERVLEQVTANVDARLSELELLGLDELQRLREWDATETVFASGTIVSLFEAEVAARAEAEAVVIGAESISYGELNCRVNQIARHLQELGVGPEVMVGLCMEPSIGMVAGILGIWKAGGAYVPVDPRYPRDRRNHILQDSGVAVIIAAAAWEEEVNSAGVVVVNLDQDQENISRHNPANLVPVAMSRNLAYVIYTSGSTGLPKGVMLEHHGLSNVAAEQRRRFGAGFGSRVLQFASMSFDASVFEMVMALGTGGTLLLGNREELLPGRRFVEWLDQQRITHLTAPPSVLSAMPGGSLATLRVIMAAGEECTERLADRWADGRDFFNLYGPTEATIWATAERCAVRGGKPKIGKPIGNVQVRLLDGQLQPVPVGVPGEICIGGVGVGRGYLNHADWTAEKFVPDPGNPALGARLYRTGDMGRYGEDGRIEFLGRKDQQVKVRGFRIELGEIEALLKAEPEVQDAYLAVLERDTGDKRIAGYYLLQAGCRVAGSELLERLKSKLPEHTIPSSLTLLDSLPRMPNGKVDRRKLLENEPQLQPEMATASVARLSLVEEALSEIWRKVLEVQTIQVDDNFFEVGGHSLLATQLLARIEEEFALELPLQHFFEAPTISGMAGRLHQIAISGSSPSWSPIVPIKKTGSMLPLFLVHPYGGRADLYARFVKYLHPEQPTYGLQAQEIIRVGMQGEVEFNSLEEMATHYIRAISAIAPRGPYYLGGYSYGGNVAFEMAQQLVKMGHEVALLAIIGSNLPKKQDGQQEPDESDFVIDTLQSRNRSYDWMGLFPDLQQLKGEEKLKYVASRLKESKQVPDSYDFPVIQRLARRAKNRFMCVANYVPRVYPGQITVFQSQGTVDTSLCYDWNELSSQMVQSLLVPGSHLTMVEEPHVQVLVRELSRCLANSAALHANGCKMDLMAG